MANEQKEQPGQENEILETSQSYSQMAELLKVERPPEVMEMIKQILESNAPINEKIRKIQLIDAQDIGQEINETELSDQEIQDIIRKKRVTTEDVVQKNSEKINSKLFRSPFLIYLFKDFKKIREFGRATDLLRFGLIPSNIKLNTPSVRAFFVTIQKDALELIEPLTFVLEKGWMDMDKMDYNLVAVFKSLCEMISSSPLPQQGYTPKQLIERYKQLFSLFLTCHYQVEYPEIIRASVVHVLENHRKPAGMIELAEIQIQRILYQGDTSPSLYNFLLALNMMEYRRYLKLGDLIRKQPGGVINTFSFECNPAIQQKINVYINDKAKSWQMLLQEKADISKIQYFLKRFIKEDTSGYRSYNFHLFIEFYEFVYYDKEVVSFARDKDNIGKLAVNFFTKFISEFEDFFIGKLPIEDYGNVRIFSGEVFQFEIDKMRLALSKMTDASFAFPIVSRREFYDIKTAKKDVMPAPNQLALLQMIDTLTDILVTIGKKLGHIHIYQKTMPPDGKNPMDLAPLETNITRSHNFSIPYWEKHILTAGYLKERIFGDAVSVIASLCFLGAVYFYNMRLYSVLEKELKINDLITETRKSLERLADVVTFEKIKKIHLG